MLEQQVVLVVGACGLDRLLCVPKYPAADSKIRTTSYHEIGGGNAANTAATIARLTNATFARNLNIQVKYLGKVGKDPIGQQLLQELNESNVDTTSPLCLQGAIGSTTSFSTILVSGQDHTRTCLHTPGSCGELTVEDCQNVDMDVVFRNVVHLHSDSRHTSASLYLAQQAHQRGISVSCDCEKDRNHDDLDQLLQISDILFTNSGCLCEYLARLTSKYEQEQGIKPLHRPPVVETKTLGLDETTVDIVLRSLGPSAFLARWYPQLGREVIVTHGNLGSLYYRLNGFCSHEMIGDENETTTNTITITTTQETSKSFVLKHHYSTVLRDSVDQPWSLQEHDYIALPTGILSHAKVVDTTGAGDAFMGGYLLAMLVSRRHDHVPNVPLATKFGSWVAGKKVQAPGVRDSLPTGLDVDTQLGTTTSAMEKELNIIISRFNDVEQGSRAKDASSVAVVS